MVTGDIGKHTSQFAREFSESPPSRIQCTYSSTCSVTKGSDESPDGWSDCSLSSDGREKRRFELELDLDLDLRACRYLFSATTHLQIPPDGR